MNILYQKGVVGYQGNGVYDVDGETWMTIWAWKIENNIIDNSPAQNTIESNKLTSIGCESIDTVPDNNRWDKVKAFKVEHLNAYL
ncbi:hypothetical protein [Aeromonas hydrophila]|uniref:hypothetical protein n=1 Tax=Aeromonas hydrophila TaxID=644 RepID=UPI002362710A|nr:hypothetical protein [Aeromonas hydrophila]